MQIINFPFPSAPSIDALRSAEQCLLSITALELKNPTTVLKEATGGDLKLTALGRAMAAFPISPRHSRMLLAAVELVSAGSEKSATVVHYALALAAALSSESPFLEPDTVVATELKQSSYNSSEKVLLSNYKYMASC